MIVNEFDHVLIACKSIRFYIVFVCKVDQFTFVVVMASAFQTSGSLSKSLIFCQTIIYNLREVVFSLCSSQLVSLFSAKSFSVFESLFCNIVSFNEERLFKLTASPFKKSR
ncbi:MAG: hypothetical protein ACLRWH_04580 [Emergencia sp.]